MEYTQKGLRTYLSVLKLILDCKSHTSGPGEETDIGSLIVPGAGAVGLVKSLRYPNLMVKGSSCTLLPSPQ